MIALGVGGLVGGLGSAAIGANAAGNAAGVQANAADYAAQLQSQEAQNALNFQEQQYTTNQQNLAPWLKAGTAGLGNLTSLLGIGPNTGQAGYGSLSEGYTPPTLSQAENYPGYQFGLGQGEQALQNSAAAKGGAFGGNTQEALNNYAQQYAQNDYTNVYNQGFNTFEANQTNTFNRLAALSGIGQQAGTTLGQLGNQTGQNISGIDLALGQQLGSDYQNAAAATASGYVGAANAYGGALSNSTNSLSNLYLLSQLQNGGAGAGGWQPAGEQDFLS